MRCRLNPSLTVQTQLHFLLFLSSPLPCCTGLCFERTCQQQSECRSFARLRQPLCARAGAAHQGRSGQQGWHSAPQVDTCLTSTEWLEADGHELVYCSHRRVVYSRSDVNLCEVPAVPAISAALCPGVTLYTCKPGLIIPSRPSLQGERQLAPGSVPALRAPGAGVRAVHRDQDPQQGVRRH